MATHGAAMNAVQLELLYCIVAVAVAAEAARCVAQLLLWWRIELLYAGLSWFGVMSASLTDVELGYGELRPSGAARLLGSLPSLRGADFVDLGSGVGKVVLWASHFFSYNTLWRADVLRTVAERLVGSLVRGAGPKWLLSQRRLPEPLPREATLQRAVSGVDCVLASETFFVYRFEQA